MFSVPQADPDGSLHLGDLVSDILNATKCGVIIGPGLRGVKVSWWSELSQEYEEEEISEVDPLQLILLIKAIQC